MNKCINYHERKICPWNPLMQGQCIGCLHPFIEKFKDVILGFPKAEQNIFIDGMSNIDFTKNNADISFQLFEFTMKIFIHSMKGQIIKVTEMKDLQLTDELIECFRIMSQQLKIK